jgi:hypothetical protein
VTHIGPTCRRRLQPTAAPSYNTDVEVKVGAGVIDLNRGELTVILHAYKCFGALLRPFRGLLTSLTQRLACPTRASRHLLSSPIENSCTRTVRNWSVVSQRNTNALAPRSTSVPSPCTAIALSSYATTSHTLSMHHHHTHPMLHHQTVQRNRYFSVCTAVAAFPCNNALAAVPRATPPHSPPVTSPDSPTAAHHHSSLIWNPNHCSTPSQQPNLEPQPLQHTITAA